MPAKKNFKVPDWACDAIWYQIFPERFRNGDPGNDPRLGDISEEKIPGWRITPWGREWYAREPWEKNKDFWNTVFLRRYGGDLAGIREKLGYLRDLGVNALYLNPIFQSPSLHKYDASCLHHIDPTFGPDRAGDLRALARAKETEDPESWIWTAADRCFLDLVRDAHQRGIRVVIDGVFNHAGRDFFAFKDLLRHGKKSRYHEWFRIKTWHDESRFDYEGWFGHASLPELARTETNLADPVKQYLFDITRRWMDPDGDGDPADGVDGWRLDVAYCIPHGFWREWRRHVKGINPEAYLTAEIVGRADEFLQGDEFDGVMNYLWLFPTASFFAPHGPGMTATEFRKTQDEWRKAYPAACLPVLQNLLDSHDVGRIASMLENLREPIREFPPYFAFSRAPDRPEFHTGRPGETTWQALRQAVVFQMTFVGAPMLYYGTEAGMWGANDPCDRQPMLWDDLAYEEESLGLHGAVARRARGPDAGLIAFVRKATALRHAEAALRRGSLRWLDTGDERLLGYERRHRGRRITVLLNASDRPVRWKSSARMRDLWSGRRCGPGALIVGARSWRVLAPE